MLAVNEEHTRSMGNSPADIEQTIVAFLTRTNKLPDDFHADMPLYADGVGLDSLETAELSALLEDDHGSDPYSTGGMPETMAEIQAFYARAESAS
jgi:acyl carrier protein